MADAQTLRQIAQARTPFSTWLGVVLLFLMFGLIVLTTIGPSPRGTDYEQKRATNRLSKLQTQREQDQASLTSYAWVDKNKGTVRIPIDKAMQITVGELAVKKPAAAGPIATPPAAQPPAAAAAPAAAGAPPASPSPSLTPKGTEVEGHGTRAQPAAARTPPGAAPGTQPGAAASPAASPPPAAVPPSSPPPAGTPAPAGSPLPVRGATPGGQ